MALENLVMEYIAIFDKMEGGFCFSSDFAKKDPIAALSKFEYIHELNYTIWHLVIHESNINLLKHIIEKYGKELTKTPKLLISLYKRYLTLDPTYEQYYKNLAEIIIANLHHNTWEKAQKMYEFAQKQNWKAATEILNSIDY
jgi:hypothetical protein